MLCWRYDKLIVVRLYDYLTHVLQLADQMAPKANFVRTIRFKCTYFFLLCCNI